MQSEVYRKWTLYGCGIISTAIDYFFLYADTLAQCRYTEYTNDVRYSEKLNGEVLSPSKDYAVLHLIDTVAECRSILQALQAVNDFKTEEIEKYKTELLSKIKCKYLSAANSNEPEVMCGKIIKMVIEYIEREAVSIDFVLMLMSEFDPLYVKNSYGAWNENSGDKNIILFNTFSERVHDLRDWAWSLQIRKLRGKV